MKFNLKSIKQRLGNDSRLLTTIHALCLLLCGSLGFACYYLANQPNELLYEHIDLPMPLEEAERLIASVESWRTEYQNEKEKESVLLARAMQATEWLPVQRNWSDSMKSVQQLASRCNLELIEMSQGKEFTGTRVNVQSAVCQLHGSYQSVCRFLDGLTKLESPIWASELTMQNDPGTGMLTVVTHLRLPIAGTQTAGAYLIGLVGNSSALPSREDTVVPSVAANPEEPTHGY